MAPIVYDMNGSERNMEWLRSKYGNLVYLDAGETDKYELVRIDETEGIALIKVRVLGAAGGTQSGAYVANHWADDALPALDGGGHQTLWQARALVQATDNRGLSGFGLGTGSYIRDLLVGGPHTLWVLDQDLPSDGLSGVGMLGGTNHHGPLTLTFRATKGTVPAPAPPVGPADATTQKLQEIIERLDVLQRDLEQLMRHFGAG